MALVLKKVDRPRELKWYQASSMLYGDWGTSKAYVLGIAFAIFWGTIYPLVSEAVANTKISVGPPYFRQVVGPLLAALVLLMGIGPLLPWRRASWFHRCCKRGRPR